MKKIIMLIALFVSIALVGVSQKKVIILPEKEKQIPIASFDQLTVDGNFKVVLVENDQPSIYIKGSPGFIKLFKFEQKNGRLTISSKYTSTEVNNLVVINAKKLIDLIVQQESVISMHEMLMPENSSIQLNAECIIKVNNKDVPKIKINDNFEIDVLR